MGQRERIFLTAFVTIFFLFMAAARAQLDYYGVSTDIRADGHAKVELVVTFAEPTNNFSFQVIGRIDNLNASSSSGPIGCSLTVLGVSSVTCHFNFTSELRLINVSYQTNDYVKPLGNNQYFFSADYTLDQDIHSMAVAVRLPEGMALVAPDQAGAPPGRLTFAQNATTTSEEGRNIKVIWQLQSLKASQPLRFDILYENLVIPFWAELRIRQFLAFGGALGLVIGVFWFWRSRRAHKLVFSVLDDFEKRVMDVIVASNGEVNQRKVVEATNLSKAKVSRIVQSLAKRGLIEVQRLGRTNKLRLLKKKVQL